jgi:hypothetical protein
MQLNLRTARHFVNRRNIGRDLAILLGGSRKNHKFMSFLDDYSLVASNYEDSRIDSLGREPRTKGG